MAQCSDRELAYCIQTLTGQVFRVFLRIAPGDLDDVVAPVTVFRKRCIDASFFAQPRLDRQRQVVDLRTGIVVIKLATYVEPLGLEQSCDRIAGRCAATMPNVQRSGGIGGNEFNHHLSRLTFATLSKVIGSGEHGWNDTRFRIG